MESQYTSGTYDPHNPQTPSLADSQPSPNSQSQTRPSRPVPKQRNSIMDELLPLPTPSNADKKSAIIPLSVLRRTGSVAIITIFLLSVAFMASTAPEHRRTGLRTIFGVGNDVGIGGAGWVAQDLGDALNHKERPKGQRECISPRGELVLMLQISTNMSKCRQSPRPRLALNMETA